MRLKYTSLLLSLLTAWTILTWALPAQAGVYTYGASQRSVNAGIILNGTYSTAANADPYPFYILSQRPDIRPYGWNLVNPLAPRSIDSDTLTRWKAIDPANLYTLGQPVLPSMAAYWEVRLSDLTSDDLAQYDVLLLNLSQTEVFTAADSEKLRRYVDGGGVLWIEQSRAGGGTLNTGVGSGPLFSPLNNLSFSNSGGTIGLNNPPARPPILTTPYSLTEQEITSLGYSQNGQWSHTGGTPLLQSILTAGGDTLSVGQLGAGSVVVSSTQIANAISNYANGAAGNAGAYSGINYSAAPSGDLKLLCNIIASSGAGPHEHQNAHQQGGSANSLTAAVLSWTFPLGDDPSGATPLANSITGTAINGNIAYVTDAAGYLHAFDTDPSEDLDGDGNPDDGSIQDFSLGKPYDELWRVPVGVFASAPTVAYDPSVSQTAVFVEQASGGLLELDPKTGVTVGSGFMIPAASNAPSSSPNAYDATTGPAPAPTIYDGKLYAGQPTDSLFVQDLTNTLNKANIVVNIDAAQNSGTNPVEFVDASPSVGIQTESQRGADTNDIIAYVTTNHAVYTVFCGARGESLTPIPAVTPTGYNTKLQTLKPTGNAYGRVDGTTARLYTLSGGLPSGIGYTTPTPPPDFTASGGTSVFADYDLDFKATAAATLSAGTDTGPLTRTGYSASSQTNTQALDATTGIVSAPALDRSGNAYFTVYDASPSNVIKPDSALLCIHDSATPSFSTIAWRFRLPMAGEDITDADNTSYTPLVGFHFVGAPVVDGQGNVYALATNGTLDTTTHLFTGGTQAAVLCFNGLGPVTLDVFGTGLAQSIASATYTQPANTAGDQNEYGEPLAPIGPQQYVDKDSSGHLTLTNFGTLTGMNGRELSPNLSEPQPITVQYTPSSGATGTGGSTLTSAVVQLHTNLNWYVVTNASNATGLTLAGNRLYFGDSSGNLSRVIADPQAEGVPITGKVIAPGAVSTDGTTMVTSAGNANVGQIGGSLSSADGLLMVNGLSGVSCYADRTTLVVEAGRVMEVGADGQATWVVDSTTSATTAGGGTQLQNGTASTATGQTVTTDINLNHPASVTQLTRDDYLVADSGNNRVVRFDRAGKVIWELTKFNDTTNATLSTLIGKNAPLMTAGEPDTLNQPTSVQIFRQTLPGGDTAVHYLIADGGNNRVVEVTDIFGPDFKLIPGGDHQLTWISRTGDKQGRQYRYASASYFRNALGTQYVIALVTNTRIAPLPIPFTPGTLSPANRDAAGGSIVLLDYVPTGTAAGQKNGYISSLITSFKAYLYSVTISTTPLVTIKRFSIPSGAAGTAGANVTLTTLQVRNPRYLKPYTSATAGQRFLLADDNGVFDMPPPSGTVPPTASWGFTQGDYQSMQTPVDKSETSHNRGYPQPSSPALPIPMLPFVPTCVQKLSATDTLTGGALVSHYLITSGYAEGERNVPTQTRIGGEVFEVGVDAAGDFLTDTAANPAGFGPYTLSRPGNTSPLEQPTFAYRLQ